MNTRDTHELIITASGEDAEKAIKDLGVQLKGLQKELKAIEQTEGKGGDAWKQKRAEIEAARKAQDAYVKSLKQLEIGKLTLNQLQIHAKQLAREMANSDRNTKEYAENAKRLGSVKQQIEKVKNEAKELERAGMDLAKPTLWGRAKEALLEFTGLGTVGLVAAGYAIKSAFTTAINQFRDFDKAAQSLKGETGMTADMLKNLKKSAQEVGPTFGKTATEMLDAYNVIASGKSDIAQNEAALKKVTEQAIRLSTVGEMDMPTAAKTMTEALNQFGGSADDAAKYVDILATGTRVGASKISEISAALKYVGPVAQATGVSFGQTNAALQVLSQNGIKGEQAGTALRGTLLQLSKSNDKEINPTIVGLHKALDTLATRGYTAAQMTKLVGTENVSAALALQANAKKVKEWTVEIEKGGGAAAMYADKTKTLDFELKKGKATFSNLATTVGQTLAPAVIAATRFTVAFVNVLMALPKFLYDNRVSIGLLAAGILLMNGNLVAANATILYNTALTKGKTIWDNAATVATNALRLAQAGLNATMKANPIMFIVGLLVTMGGALVALYNNSQTFRAIVNGLWSAMKGFASTIASVLLPLLRELPARFTAIWSVIRAVGLFVAGPFVAAFQAASRALSGITDRIGVVRNAFLKLWEIFTGIYKRIYDGLNTLTGGALGKVVDAVKGAAQKTGAAFTKGYNDTVDKAMTKTAQEAGKKAGKGLADGHQEGLKQIETDTKTHHGKQQKATKGHLDKIKEANQEALKKLAELQNEAHLAFIKRTQGELAAEKEKLKQVHEAELKDINSSKANEQLKAQLRLAAKAKLEADSLAIEQKYEQEGAELAEKLLSTEQNKKIKQLEEGATKDLAIARKTIADKQLLAKVEQKITEQLEADKAKIKQEAADEEAAKEAKANQKRLEAEIFILGQEEKAVKAKYDNLEFAARKNKDQLLALQKERADEELRLTKERLKLEEQAEAAKLRQDIKDQDELNRKLKELSDSYRAREKEAVQKAEADKIKIEEEAFAKKKRNREAVSKAFGDLLRGDVVAAVEAIAQVSTAQQKQWQKDLAKAAEYAQMGAQMAQEAVKFLNDLAQRRADNAIKEVQREYNAKKAVWDKELADHTAAIETNEQKQKDVKQAYADQVQQIKAASTERLKSLEDAYKEATSSSTKKALSDEIAAIKENAQQKIEEEKAAYEKKVEALTQAKNAAIEAATTEKKEAIAAARQRREEAIINAEATRDAEIAAIKTRTDIDKAAKDAMIAAAKQKFEQEKQLVDSELQIKKEAAEAEAKKKVDSAEATAKTLKTLAENERDAKLKAIKEVQEGNEEAAKQTLADAKENSKKLIEDEKKRAEAELEIAEKEKNEKLRKLAEENAKKVEEKKALEAKLVAEEKAAKQKEYDIKLKAWKAQQKADIASALISGALAVIKALAMGFPVGLVMAALAGAMTGVQIAKIKKQPAPEMPTFAMGGSLYPTKGIGGLPEGPRHGSRPGERGVFLVDSETKQIRGEMEGKEWIVGRDQTEANLPLLQAMHEKSKRRDRSPLFSPEQLASLRQTGVLPQLGHRMWVYGGRFKRYEVGGPVEPDGGGIVENSGQANAGFEEAKKSTQEHTTLLKKIHEETHKMRLEVSHLLNRVAGSSQETAYQTRETASAIRSQNLSGLVQKLGSFK